MEHTMFNGFSEQTIDFLWGIRLNNEKSWFESHKEEYKRVLEQPMKALASEVYKAFNEKYPELGLFCYLSRIYRDARRLFGRGPYKDCLWFTLARGEDRLEKPSFWFEIMPATWTYGLGYYSAKPITMLKHRRRIDNNPKPMEKLARALNHQTEFVLEGEDYKRPKGDPGELLYDWYNKKTFSLIHEEKVGSAIYSPDLVQRLLDGFSFLVPYYEYFSSLDSDPDPDM